MAITQAELSRYTQVLKLRINEDEAYFGYYNNGLTHPPIRATASAFGTAQFAVTFNADGNEFRWYTKPSRQDRHVALVDVSQNRYMGRITYTNNGLLYVSHLMHGITSVQNHDFDICLCIQTLANEWSMTLTDQEQADSDIVRYRDTEGRIHLPERYMGLAKRREAVEKLRQRRSGMTTPRSQASTPSYTSAITPKRELSASPKPSIIKPKAAKAKPKASTSVSHVPMWQYGMPWPSQATASHHPGMAPAYAPMPVPYGMPFGWPWGVPSGPPSDWQPTPVITDERFSDDESDHEQDETELDSNDETSNQVIELVNKKFAGLHTTN